MNSWRRPNCADDLQRDLAVAGRVARAVGRHRERAIAERARGRHRQVGAVHPAAERDDHGAEVLQRVLQPRLSSSASAASSGVLDSGFPFTRPNPLPPPRLRPRRRRRRRARPRLPLGRDLQLHGRHVRHLEVRAALGAADQMSPLSTSYSSTSMSASHSGHVAIPPSSGQGSAPPARNPGSGGSASCDVRLPRERSGLYRQHRGSCNAPRRGPPEARAQRAYRPCPLSDIPGTMATETVAAKTVVIADDTAFVRERFQTALHEAGHRAVTVKSAAELLGRVRADLDSTRPAWSSTCACRTHRAQI